MMQNLLQFVWIEEILFFSNRLSRKPMNTNILHLIFCFQIKVIWLNRIENQFHDGDRSLILIVFDAIHIQLRQMRPFVRGGEQYADRFEWNYRENGENNQKFV